MTVKKMVLIFLFTIALLNADEFKKVEKIVLSGPPASVSHPLLHMIESKALKDLAKKIEFKIWKNPDELRALILRGDIDFVAVPTNVAANLYNKNIDIKLLNVSIWGILSIITRDKNKKSLKDFRGSEIAIPFRGDMPDIVFKEIVKAQGMDPKKDFKLIYLSAPSDAMQMLITRRVDHALLAEPITSMALRKTKSFPISLISPDLYRSVDIQKEWGKTFNTEEKIPQAGIAVIGKKDDYIIKRVNEEYKKSLKWYKTHPKEAGILVNKYIPMLMPEAVADSIKYTQLNFVPAAEAKKDLEFFFKVLKKSDPKSIGGKLPDSNFYYNK